MSNCRIGVYVCHCGSNIAGKVRVDEVARYAKDYAPDEVVISREYKYMCSDPGQDLIKKDIKEFNLNRIVVASCSPLMHEKTFRNATADGGINPFFFQMANIREHVSWVTEDENAATEKAKALLIAAIHRVMHHEALEKRTVHINPQVLIVGGGIAGITAALQIADAGNKVFLVEKSPSIGGHMAQLDKTFPTLDCSACILTPKMTSVGQHPNITLMTYSEVQEVNGYVGNFKVKVLRKAKSVDHEKCTGCGVCTQKCPMKAPNEFELNMAPRKAIYTPFPQAVPNKPVIDKTICTYYKNGRCKACEKFCGPGAILFDEQDRIEEIEVGSIILATGYDLKTAESLPEYGFGRYPNVFTAFEFERLVNSSGPTGGKIVTREGKEPKSIGILHCIGSRDKKYCEYCSRVCCMYALKFSHLIKEKYHDCEVYQFYIDMRCFGKGYEEFYNRLLKEGVNFVRGKVAEITDAALEPSEEGKLIMRAEDTMIGTVRRIPVDMAILCLAMVAKPEAKELSHIFSCSVGKDGWFTEKHPKLAPVSTASDGIFIAGACQGPKDIPDTVAQAGAAAAEVLNLIQRGEVEAEVVTADIEEDLCSGCRTCVELCPYTAITYNAEKKKSEINGALCKGCGTCVGACPSGAAYQRNFRDEQIYAEIKGILAV
ncbi:MAG TPA: CoB--CoM heterodisulfide reductase iron-sulfur subunit A family protein [Acidobacteriota bacterium]|nr:CoB--CoM heterodisulfide reductase iron-sulfur subunit A family protein [Acidobacteriota bacterium]HNT17887.1 CoB--CoM heterodisulfide reductase iron-sulfur subunit A family protein [Acidobacteriota bacterium]HPA27554.1 CoB--CoM heterodisulfide reductase iron-sulfur subunit A family protein [Acidobacteriota bacterium]HQO20372.1 CoB--CoM heterodisulfide reductase iron-sulfur subunit A family protein [Acidobacteriota bacterium]HQQ47737.1 CoB--CoM heterodisulfide reductase iron-sulfur subunit A